MSRKSRKNVGVIGLGIIGTRVAAGLRAAGFQVYVWNRSAKPAPNFLGSPGEIADSAEIIQIFVADAPALFEVLEAMGESLTPKHIVICSATVGPEAVLEAAQIVESRGAQFLDAPFTGSKLAAEKRQLVYYVGGSEDTYLKVKPVLEATSKAMVRIGEIGHAASVKVVTNMISAVTTQVLAEALSIVQKAGLEPEVLASALEHNACRSGVIDLKLPKMIAGDFDPHFSLKHMFKDVQLGIHMANALDIEIPATTVTAGVMYGALNQGWGDLDYAALFKNYTETDTPDELPALPTSAAALFSEEAALIEQAKTTPPVAPSADTVSKIESPDDAEKKDISQSDAPASTATTAAEPVSGDAANAPLKEAVVTETAATPAPAGEAAAEKTKGDEQAKKDSPAEPADKAPADKEAEAATAKKADEKPAAAPGGDVTPADARNGKEEAPSRATNFVKRWFVARSGGG